MRVVARITRQADAATLGLVRRERRRDLDVAVAKKTVIGIGDYEAVFVPVGHGVFAARRDDEIFDSIIVNIGHELRRPRQRLVPGSSQRPSYRQRRRNGQVLTEYLREFRWH